jgi:uncharacterized protein
MAFTRWFGLGRDRAEEAALEARVTALQTALTKCKEVAGRWAPVRREFMAATATLCLAAGFILGVYREPIAQTFMDLAVTVGIASPVHDATAAEVAYQKGKYETALRIARPLAEQGDARAQSLLGRMYSRGRGVPLDEAEAGNWFRSAAGRGNAGAQLTLGNMYAEGRGVPQDYAEAAKWYRLAAEQGDPQAQYNLGLSYAKGEGVSQSNISAHMWFNIAASRFASSDAASRGLATSNRDVVAKEMTSEEIAEAQKRARDWKPK